MQIGEVAERTGLSLRTIRHYEEVGLVAPSARSKGGFRLYTEADVERLMVIRRMKPLDFSLEEMRDLLEITDRLADTDAEVPTDEKARLRERLDSYRKVADARCETLRAQLMAAEDFAATLRRRLGN
jgi:DNA-binding transcriptional MerR regulator